MSIFTTNFHAHGALAPVVHYKPFACIKLHVSNQIRSVHKHELPVSKMNYIYDYIADQKF